MYFSGLKIEGAEDVAQYVSEVAHSCIKVSACTLGVSRSLYLDSKYSEKTPTYKSNFKSSANQPPV